MSSELVVVELLLQEQRQDPIVFVIMGVVQQAVTGHITYLLCTYSITQCSGIQTWVSANFNPLHLITAQDNNEDSI